MENNISYSHKLVACAQSIRRTHDMRGTQGTCDVQDTSPRQDTRKGYPYYTRQTRPTASLGWAVAPQYSRGTPCVGWGWNPDAGWGGRSKWKPISILLCCMVVLSIALSACGNQSQQVDSRLKYFKVLSSRVLIVGNNAEVFGELENTSKMTFPFDVSLQANLMDISGQSVGTAMGTAEDVGLGQVREFLLAGNVDGTRYARLKVTVVSLQEKRVELNMPTPTPLSP